MIYFKLLPLFSIEPVNNTVQFVTAYIYFNVFLAIDVAIFHA